MLVDIRREVIGSWALRGVWGEGGLGHGEGDMDYEQPSKYHFVIKEFFNRRVFYNMGIVGNVQKYNKMNISQIFLDNMLMLLSSFKSIILCKFQGNYICCTKVSVDLFIIF